MLNTTNLEDRASDSFSSINLNYDIKNVEKKISLTQKILEFSPAISSTIYSYLYPMSQFFCCDLRGYHSLNSSQLSLTSGYAWSYASSLSSYDLEDLSLQPEDFLGEEFDTRFTKWKKMSHIVETQSNLEVSVKNYKGRENLYPLPSFSDYPLIESTFEINPQIVKISKKKAVNRKYKRLALIKASNFRSQGIFSLVPSDSLLVPERYSRWYKTIKHVRFAIYHAISEGEDKISDLDLFVVKREKIKCDLDQAAYYLNLIEKKLDKEYHFTSLIGTECFKAMRVSYTSGNRVKISSYFFSPYFYQAKLTHSMELLCDIFAKIASELQRTQKLGVLHGDLDPSNIIIDINGEPQLIDWEMAVDIDDSDARRSGKEGFMAPDLRKSWSSESFSLLKTILSYMKSKAHIYLKDEIIAREITLKVMYGQQGNYCFFRRFQKKIQADDIFENFNEQNQSYRNNRYDPTMSHRALLLGDRKDQNLPFYKNFIRSLLFFEILPTVKNKNIAQQEKIIIDTTALYMLYEYCIEHTEQEDILLRPCAFEIEQFCLTLYDKLIATDDSSVSLLEKYTFALDLMKRYFKVGNHYTSEVMKALLYSCTTVYEQDFLECLLSKGSVSYNNQIFIFHFLKPEMRIGIMHWPNLLKVSEQIALAYLKDRHESDENLNHQVQSLRLLCYFYCLSLHFEYVLEQCDKNPRLSKEFFSYNKKALLDEMKKEIEFLKSKEKYNLLMNLHKKSLKKSTPSKETSFDKSNSLSDETQQRLDRQKNKDSQIRSSSSEQSSQDPIIFSEAKTDSMKKNVSHVKHV